MMFRKKSPSIDPQLEAKSDNYSSALSEYASIFSDESDKPAQIPLVEEPFRKETIQESPQIVNLQVNLLD